MTLSVAFEHGIHARPAARIAALAKSIAADITVTVHGRRASARSATALMSLGARRGDELTFSACGPDAAASLERLRRGVLELPDSLPAEAGTLCPQPDASTPASRVTLCAA